MATNDCLIPAGNPAAGTAGLAAMVIDCRTAEVTVRVVLPVMPWYVADRLAVPTFTAEANPNGLIVATEVVAELQAAVLLRSKVDASE